MNGDISIEGSRPDINILMIVIEILEYVKLRPV